MAVDMMTAAQGGDPNENSIKEQLDKFLKEIEHMPAREAIEMISLQLFGIIGEYNLQQIAQNDDAQSATNTLSGYITEIQNDFAAFAPNSGASDSEKAADAANAIQMEQNIQDLWGSGYFQSGTEDQINSDLSTLIPQGSTPTSLETAWENAYSSATSSEDSASLTDNPSTGTETPTLTEDISASSDMSNAIQNVSQQQVAAAQYVTGEAQQYQSEESGIQNDVIQFMQTVNSGLAQASS